jgi:hypothetical protein
MARGGFMVFEVVIAYREPTFEARIGRSANAPPFRAYYRVEAADAPAALRLALDLFERDFLESGSGWVREPVRDACAARRVA